MLLLKIKDAKVNHQITPHFSVNEVACPCCGIALINETILNIAEDFRIWISEKMDHHADMLNPSAELSVKVNSGYRCPRHNKEIGGEDGSKHMRGDALDLAWEHMQSWLSQAVNQHELVQWCIANGVRGLGIGTSLVHMDCAEDRDHFCIWYYTGK